jgi:hypothetical protein
MFDSATRVHTSLLLKGGIQVGALANLYALSDWSIQQLAIGLAMLPLLVALAWYVSHPAHRRQLSATTHGPGTRARLRSGRSHAKVLSARTEAASLLAEELGTGSDVTRGPVEGQV